MVADTTWDKIGVAMEALILSNSMRARQQGGSSAPSTTGKGSIATIAELISKAYREGGGTLHDEALILEHTFGADPSGEPQFIEKLETKKIAALMKILEDWEKFNLRLELLLLDTEVVKTSTPGGVKKGDDGKPEMGDDGKPKKVAATTREEKSKVNRRINVLKGIAAHIDDDMNEVNLKHVAKMMRDIGALGNITRSQRLQKWTKDNVSEKKVAAFFGQESISDIRYKMVEDKFVEFIGPAPDPTLPRPNDKAWWIKRVLRNATLGSFPNVEVERRPTNRRLVIGITAIVVVILALTAFTLAFKKIVPSETDRIINAYQPPAETPAIAPVK